MNNKKFMVIETSERDVLNVTVAESLDEAIEAANKALEEWFRLIGKSPEESGKEGESYQKASIDDQCAWSNLGNDNWDAHILPCPDSIYKAVSVTQAQAKNAEKNISVVYRDIDGKRKTKNFSCEEIITNRDEFLIGDDLGTDILMVFFDEKCIFSQLQSEYPLTWEDLYDFFA